MNNAKIPLKSSTESNTGIQNFPENRSISDMGGAMMHLAWRAIRESWGLLVALLCLIALFSLISPYFFNSYAAEGIIKHASFTLIMAIGMTLVIATGGIDVSVGATLALTSMVSALAMTSGVPVLLSVFLGLLLGAGIGALNGGLISGLKLQAFIVTLAMLSLARGLTLILSDGSPVSNLPDAFGDFFGGENVIPLSFGLLLIVMYVIHQTRYGIQIRGIGSSEATCYICGVQVSLVRIGVYAFQGVLATIAGFTLSASFDAAEPTAGLSTEWLEAIAAPIIGGNALAGGRIRLFGMVLGCLILATMRSGLNISGVPVSWQQVAIGMIIVAAVALDVLTHRRRVS